MDTIFDLPIIGKNRVKLSRSDQALLNRPNSVIICSSDLYFINYTNAYRKCYNDIILCLVPLHFVYNLRLRRKSCWDCKQSVEVPDTKLWHCDIFFKHSCNSWNKDLKNIWLWIRSVEQFVVLTMCYTKKEQNYLCYAIILIKSPYK